jgi:hypothetical protein
MVGLVVVVATVVVVVVVALLLPLLPPLVPVAVAVLPAEPLLEPEDLLPELPVPLLAVALLVEVAAAAEPPLLLLVLLAVLVRLLEPPAPTVPPPVRPIRASTMHFTEALLALSSEPFSVTTPTISPSSTVSVVSEMVGRETSWSGRKPAFQAP